MKIARHILALGMSSSSTTFRSCNLDVAEVAGFLGSVWTEISRRRIRQRRPTVADAHDSTCWGPEAVPLMGLDGIQGDFTGTHIPNRCAVAFVK
jgi:hypothetical protein